MVAKQPKQHHGDIFTHGHHVQMVVNILVLVVYLQTQENILAIGSGMNPVKETIMCVHLHFVQFTLTLFPFYLDAVFIFISPRKAVQRLNGAAN